MANGHGWVHPNMDGTKARCGGPAICGQCAKEQAEVEQLAINAGLMPGKPTEEMVSVPVPFRGCIVDYVDDDGQIHTAIITKVLQCDNPYSTVVLTVFLNHGTAASIGTEAGYANTRSLPRGDPLEPGCWSWPVQAKPILIPKSEVR